MARQRKLGDPCLCTSWGHGHDEEQCGNPVHGRTRGGRIKKICDDCSHIARINKMGELTLPPTPPKPIQPITAQQPEPPPITPPPVQAPEPERALKDLWDIMHEDF